MSLILVTLMSCCDPDFDCLNTNFNENKLDGVDLTLMVLTTAFETMEEKFDGFQQTDLMKYNAKNVKH